MNTSTEFHGYPSCAGTCAQGRYPCNCDMRMPQAASACSEFLTENTDDSDQDSEGAGWELLGAALFIVSGIVGLWVLA